MSLTTFLEDASNVQLEKWDRRDSLDFREQLDSLEPPVYPDHQAILEIME